ncbi:MAG: uracil-DNA glycosylase [Rhodocyclaceae bacterium]|nr:uracil-DNA glycosylase [Rhodocyclaceae bacterium]MBX3670342.1 uracil-DNA glycosylase [Rhodocyclaceae bacterium]
MSRAAPPDSAMAAFMARLTAGKLIPDPARMFNPWGDHDAEHDLAASAAAIRAGHLHGYLAARLVRARVLLVAEAPSYSGAKFSGIAMTSERDMLAAAANGAGANYFDGPIARTSRPLAALHNQAGMLERTASIVWSAMTGAGFAPQEFVLWNAVAYHPHEAGQVLTNRTPTRPETRALRPLLEDFLALFPGRPVLALGRVCQGSLTDMGIEAAPARHPSYGGAPEFRAAVLALKRRLDV